MKIKDSGDRTQFDTGAVSIGWWPNDNKPIGTKEGN